VLTCRGRCGARVPYTRNSKCGLLPRYSVHLLGEIFQFQVALLSLCWRYIRSFQTHTFRNMLSSGRYGHTWTQFQPSFVSQTCKEFQRPSVSRLLLSQEFYQLRWTHVSLLHACIEMCTRCSRVLNVMVWLVDFRL
jgi:hypothetical protein